MQNTVDVKFQEWEKAYLFDAHDLELKDREKVVIDHLGGWQGSRKHPLKLSEVMPQIRSLADRYGFSKVRGDQFGSEPH